MDYSFVPHLILLISVTSMVSVGVYTWSHRRMPGATMFGATMLLGALCALTTMLEMAASDFSTKLFWIDVRYICYSASPVTALLSVLQYTGRDQWASPRRILILSIIPFLTVVLAWTNSFHGLIRTGTHFVSNSFPLLAEDFSPWFWVHVAYSLVLLFASLFMLSEAAVRAPRAYRGQPLALLVGLALPAISRIAYYHIFSSVPQIDLAPFTLAISGVVLAWGLVRYRLFDIVLVARDMVIEGMGDKVIVLNSRQQIIDMSPSATKTFGIELKNIIGMDASRAFANWPNFVQICTSLEPTQTDFIMGSQQEACYFEVHASPLMDNLDRPNGRVVVMRDATERRTAEDLLTTIALSFPIGVYIVNDGKFQFVNPQFLKQTGYAENEIIGRHALSFVFQEDRNKVRESALKMLRGESSQPYEYRFINANREMRWAIETVAHIQYEGGLAIIGSFMDITDRKEQEDRLAYLASHDSLTGLHNRHVLYENLQRSVARALRGSESVLLLFDLDNFKKVNDSLGHLTGDRTLELLAKLLRSQLRAEDLLVRLGGDEFAVLLEGTSVEEAFAVASRMKEAVGNYEFSIEGGQFKLSLSIGLVKVDGLETPERLLSQADSAMYEAKEKGRNSIVSFSLMRV